MQNVQLLLVCTIGKNAPIFDKKYFTAIPVLYLVLLTATPEVTIMAGKAKFGSEDTQSFSKTFPIFDKKSPVRPAVKLLKKTKKGAKKGTFFALREHYRSSGTVQDNIFEMLLTPDIR